MGMEAIRGGFIKREGFYAARTSAVIGNPEY
jgi:hypothetical protein